MNLETIKKDRIDSGGFVGYERELIIQLEERDREIERLREIEVIAQAFVNTWNEFEQPMPLEWDMPDPMRTIHEWASEWKNCAEKAEARVEAQDIVIAEYKADDYDRIKKLVGALEKIAKLLQVHPEQIIKAAWRYKVYAIVTAALA